MIRALALSSAAWMVLLVGSLAGCKSVRGDEALVVVDVLASPDMPPFTMVRLSIVGRPEIQSFEAPFDADRELRFGYYLPGPNGKAEVRAEALSSPACVLGAGTAEVDVQLSRTSSAVPLVVHRAQAIDAACLMAPDGGGGQGDGDRDGDGGPAGGGADAPGDALASDARADGTGGQDGTTDGPGDARPPNDAGPDVSAPPPACMPATRTCSATTACCAPLACSTNVTYGTTRICCGNFNAGCTRVDTGQDCCGQLECRSGKCCLPARYPCPSGGECCDTLVCGTNVSYGTTKICCGNNGHACSPTGNGADCCGLLRCVDGVCRP